MLFGLLGCVCFIYLCFVCIEFLFDCWILVDFVEVWVLLFGCWMFGFVIMVLLWLVVCCVGCYRFDLLLDESVRFRLFDLCLCALFCCFVLFGLVL